MEGSHQEGHLRRGYRGTVLGVQGIEPGDGKRWCTCNSGMEGAGPQARRWGEGPEGLLLSLLSVNWGGQGDEESKASARFSTSGTRRMRVPRSHSAGLQEPPYEALSDILKRRQTVNKQQVTVLTHLGLSAPGGKS